MDRSLDIKQLDGITQQIIIELLIQMQQPKQNQLLHQPYLTILYQDHITALVLLVVPLHHLLFNLIEAHMLIP